MKRRGREINLKRKKKREREMNSKRETERKREKLTPFLLLFL